MATGFSRLARPRHIPPCHHSATYMMPFFSEPRRWPGLPSVIYFQICRRITPLYIYYMICRRPPMASIILPQVWRPPAMVDRLTLFRAIERDYSPLFTFFHIFFLLYHHRLHAAFFLPFNSSMREENTESYRPRPLQEYRHAMPRHYSQRPYGIICLNIVWQMRDARRDDTLFRLRRREIYYRKPIATPSSTLLRFRCFEISHDA